MPRAASGICIVSLTLLFSCWSVSPGYATPEFAEKTGNPCRVCHLDPLGGGPLRDFGKGYLLSLRPTTLKRGAKGGFPSRLFRLVIGYVHLATAFLWFGTILYVHLVLKPAYASEGLPRGEVRVGLISMFVIAVTGALLTYFKVPSADMLFSSRFGRLLLAKIALFVLMASSALYVVLVIGPRLRTSRAARRREPGRMTRDELEGFDGREGRPAYIAFQGKIYDVGNSVFWKEGMHMKRHRAGADLTPMLSQAPHGEEKVTNMPERGRLISRDIPPSRRASRSLFFFMAYLNLACVFLVMLILALWQWP